MYLGDKKINLTVTTTMMVTMMTTKATKMTKVLTKVTKLTMVTDRNHTFCAGSKFDKSAPWLLAPAR